MTNYFQHPYCSNSRLSALGRELGILPELKGDIKEAYRAGALFDARVTEFSLLDLIQMTISGSEIYSFTKEEYGNVKAMHDSLRKNRVYAAFENCKPERQKEVYVESFDFGDFKLNMRAKLDFYIPGLVADLKSTTCTTQKSFIASCEQFGYWRQMVLYCKLTNCKQATLFAVSKTKPYPVFTASLSEGDERWQAGEKELNFLAYKYFLTHE